MSRKIRLRICCGRRSRLASLLALALLVALLLGVQVTRGRGASAAGAAPQSLPTLRLNYYLTQGFYNGAGADETGVCAAGYHFASLWEILDPSNLKYDAELGLTKDDSGQGPPTFSNFGGWVRTGYSSSVSSTPGMGNCAAWTSPSSADSGTYARLPNNWSVAADLHVWEVDTAPCDTASLLRVWCVADRPGFPVYLPLVLRDF